MIKELLDGIQQRLSDGAAWLFAPFQFLIDWSPLFGHFALFVALIAFLLFVGFFLPFKWIRAGLGFVIVVAGAFVLGETNQFKKQLKDAKARRQQERRKAVPPPRPREGGGGFGGFFGGRQ